MASKKAQEITIEIKPIKLVKTKIAIVGDTPLIVHAWSEKAKRMMLEAQQKTAKTKKAKDPKNPFEDFFDSLYWLDGKPERKTEKAFAEAVASGRAKFGFPVTGIKQAALAASYRAGVIPNMACMKGAFFLNGTDGTGMGDMATIEGSAPESREDMVRIGSAMTSTADIRYRAMFREWRIPLMVTHNDNGTFSLEQIVNAINLGGFMCGIGEWRPERDGQFGMFHVELEGK